MSFKSRSQHFVRPSSLYGRKRGASLISYALLLGLIGIFALATISILGQQVTALFSGVADGMQTGDNGSPNTGGGGANLIANQPSLTGLDATGPGSPAMGTPVLLGFTNQGNGATAALSVSLQGHAYFVISADMCTTVILDSGQSCQVEITPQSHFSGIFSAVLTVTDGQTSASSSLSGTASDLPSNAMAWGRGDSGQLGNGALLHSTTPVSVDGGYFFISLTQGTGYSCGVANSGELFCWGWINSSTELEPVIMAEGYSFSSISSPFSGEYFCGVLTTGQGVCWGNGTFGELGNGEFVSSSTPVFVNGGYNFQNISAGAQHSCGITTAGTALCWGNGTIGQLGDGGSSASADPVEVDGEHVFTRISSGTFHNCGVTSLNEALCWGGGGEGRLGNGSNVNSLEPVSVDGGYSFSDVSAGNLHSCGVTTSGTALCWGQGTIGELGNGETNSSNIPVTVTGGHSFATISAGHSYSCGVTTMGAGFCWGQNGLPGRLGAGNTTAFFSAPQPVSGLHSFSSILAGYEHTLAILQ